MHLGMGRAIAALVGAAWFNQVSGPLCWCTLVVPIDSKTRQAPPDPKLDTSKQFAQPNCSLLLFRIQYCSLASATMHSMWHGAPYTLMAGASVVSTRRHCRLPGLWRQILPSSNARALPLPPKAVIPRGVCGRLHS